MKRALKNQGSNNATFLFGYINNLFRRWLNCNPIISSILHFPDQTQDFITWQPATTVKFRRIARQLMPPVQQVFLLVLILYAIVWILSILF